MEALELCARKAGGLGDPIAQLLLAGLCGEVQIRLADPMHEGHRVGRSLNAGRAARTGVRMLTSTLMVLGETCP